MHHPGVLPSSPDIRFLAVAARVRPLVLLLCLFAAAHRSVAQEPAGNFILTTELPAAPSPQLPNPIASGAIAGTVTDHDGATVAGVRLTLTPDGQPPPEASAIRTAISTSDGRFSFPNVPPGRFRITIAATGFAPQRISGDLQAGEDRELSTIVLLSGTTIDVQVTASQEEIAEAQINQEEKQRVLGIFPNFYVSYIPNPVSLAPRQKFELAFKTLVDPVSLLLNGVTAGVQQADNTYSWGQGVQGYAKRYAAAYGTFLTGTIIGDGILPVVFKQDPRYFYKGTGSVHSRVLYALANAVICKGDNHRWQPNYSAILGGIAAGGISNFYYPAVNRSGIGLTFEGAAIGTGFSAVTNVLQEFLIHKLTPHIPPPPPPTPKAPANPPPPQG
jgi:Carboxypeptidase regulatory-like domain